jgi:hypothetical protein
MSEAAPERAAPPAREGGGGGFMSTFTNKIGPLPMWAWVAIIAVILVVWRWHSAQSAAGTSPAADTSTAADQVPQFVNQTYVTTQPPVVQQPPAVHGPIESFGPVPRPQPKPEQLTRTWTAPTGGVSTLAQIAQRLTGTADPSRLTPANPVAVSFIKGPFAKNKNAKVPRGATFTYNEGTITPKSQAA